ncbi:MAG: SHOCT domain-containing protein [Pseudomonadota bacterium]
MKVQKTSLAVLVLALSASLAGCGSSTETTVENKETKGQQLMDLKEALDTGAITQEEYEELRERVLD